MATGIERLIIPEIAYSFAGPFDGPYHVIESGPNSDRELTTCCGKKLPVPSRGKEIRHLRPGQLCFECLKAAGLKVVTHLEIIEDDEQADEMEIAGRVLDPRELEERLKHISDEIALLYVNVAWQHLGKPQR